MATRAADEAQAKAVKRLMVLLIVVWLVSWGGTFVHWFTDSAEVNESIRHFGLAFGLAGFLGLTVDYYLKLSLAKEIVRETAPYIFTHGMPDELRDELINARDFSLVRRDLLLEFIFRERGEHLEFETTTSFSLENFAATDQDDIHRAVVVDDKHRSVQQCEILQFQATGADIAGGGHSFRHPNVPAIRRTQESEPALKIERPIRIRPNSGRVRNAITSKTFAIFGKSDEEIFIFATPIIGLRIQVNEKPSNLRVYVIVPHRLRDRLQPKPLEDPMSWTLDAGFLPWSAVSVAWRMLDDGVGVPKSPENATAP